MLTAVSLLPPELEVEVVVFGEVFVVCGPEVGGEVLPATVGEEHDDVGFFAALLVLGGGALGSPQGGASGNAGEDAFLLHELLGAGEGVLGADDDAAVKDGVVEDWRDEALVHAAEALDTVARVRRRG